MSWYALAVVSFAAGACGGDGSSGPLSVAAPEPPPVAPSTPVTVTLVGAGDIAICGSPTTAATARLLDGIPGTIFTAGDNAYPNGTANNFRDCYSPGWGRHRGRTRPSPGNHEYDSPGAGPYYDYFGEAAGTPGLGYYSYRLGNWTVFSLNSNVPMTASSGQGSWLRRELHASPTACAVAYWHHPLFSSGPHSGFPPARDLWRLLYEAGVDIVLNGHEHLYERFAPQDPDGVPDAVRGVRQFTVGTGGAELYTPMRLVPNTEIVVNDFGVLKLTLSVAGYRWEFIDIDGRVRDAGAGTCH